MEFQEKIILRLIFAGKSLSEALIFASTNLQYDDRLFIELGAIFILRKDIGVGGWSRKWQFSLTLCSKNVLT